MAKITRIDVPGVNVALAGLKAAIDDFDKALNGDDGIRPFAESLRGCWGDDETGEKFGKTYLQQEGDVLDTSQQTVVDLNKFVEDMKTIVEMFQELDATSAQYLEFQD
jgi:hypothetical protein